MTAPILCRGVNIADHVAAMFDSLVQSLGWGSGFLDAEEVESILIVAALAGFDVPEGDLRFENFDPPGFVPEATPRLPDAARVPEGGWPSDPAVYDAAQRLVAEHRQAAHDVGRRNQEARAAAIAAWRAQVKAKAQALAAEAER